VESSGVHSLRGGQVHINQSIVKLGICRITFRGSACQRSSVDLLVSIAHVEVVAGTLLFAIFDRLLLVDTGSKVCRVAAERDFKILEELVHTRQQRLRCGGSGLHEKRRCNELFESATLSSLQHLTSIPGCPSYTTTESAKYVAMMKSCSTTKALRLEWEMKRLITLEAMIRCSESR